MGCNKYPHMFAPMTIKGVTFKNRVLASPDHHQPDRGSRLPHPRGH